MGFGLGSRGVKGGGSWEKLGGRPVVGLLGRNKKDTKDIYRFTFPVTDDNSVYVTLNVYPDSTFDIIKGRNAGHNAMLGWASMSKRKGGSR